MMIVAAASASFAVLAAVPICMEHVTQTMACVLVGYSEARLCRYAISGVGRALEGSAPDADGVPTAIQLHGTRAHCMWRR